MTLILRSRTTERRPLAVDPRTGEVLDHYEPDGGWDGAVVRSDKKLDFSRKKPRLLSSAVVSNKVESIKMQPPRTKAALQLGSINAMRTAIGLLFLVNATTATPGGADPVHSDN